MASFTENNIPQFNPYIQQQPLEQMVTVGVEKQRRYDEGLQKIQTNIENIAGLDVIRDVDKTYLNSKLNQLGSKLKTVAAGDFSNYQLTNSVGGMVKQIGKDGAIQNAVMSTARYRKEASFVEEERKAGKASPDNIWDFNLQANDWLNSDDINKSFSGKYTPYTDVKKKIMTDVIGKLMPNLKQEDIPWESNADGTLNYNKIAAAMTRLSSEEVSATQIKNAINASLTPTELNQLSISGRYQFRDATPEALDNYVRKQYSTKEADIDSTIKALEGYANMNKSDTEVYAKTIKSIESYKLAKAALPSQLEKELALSRANPDLLKVEIYKNGFVDSFSEAFSWEKKKKQLIDNPYENARQWSIEMQLKRDVEARQRSQDMWNRKMDVAKLDTEKEKLKLEYEKLYGKTTSMETYLGNAKYSRDPLTALTDSAIGKEAEYNAYVQQLVQETGITPAGAIQQINEFRQDPTKTKIPVHLRGNAATAIQAKIDGDNLRQTILQAEQKASAQLGGVYNQEVEDKLRALPSIALYKDGQPIVVSNKEILDYLHKTQNSDPYGMKSGRTPFNPGGESKYYSTLSTSQKLLDQSLKDPNNKNRMQLNAALEKYTPALSSFKSYQDNYTENVYKNLEGKLGKYLPKVGAIIAPSAEARSIINSKANTVLLRYKGDLAGGKGGAEDLSQDEIEQASTWLTGKEKDNIKFSKFKQGDETKLVLSLGGKDIAIPLTGNEAQYFPQGIDELSPQEERVLSTQLMFNGNTNGTHQPTRSIFQPSDFANVKTLKVTADLQQDKSPGRENINYLNLNLRLPSGWKNLQLSDYPIDALTLIRKIPTMTDAEIKALYLSDPSVPEEWKQEIKNLK